MGKLQEEFDKYKWHHDWDMDGKGYSITIEDFEKIIKQMKKEFPLTTVNLHRYTKGEIGIIADEVGKWFENWLEKGVDKI